MDHYSLYSISLAITHESYNQLKKVQSLTPYESRDQTCTVLIRAVLIQALEIWSTLNLVIWIGGESSCEKGNEKKEYGGGRRHCEIRRVIGSEKDGDGGWNALDSMIWFKFVYTASWQYSVSSLVSRQRSRERESTAQSYCLFGRDHHHSSVYRLWDIGPLGLKLRI